MKHLLVTNDFPPKIGGIQSLLWELWRRLPSDSFSVVTTPYEGDAAFDAAQPFAVVRTKQRWLLPTRAMVKQINQLADDTGAELIVLDPAFPLGLCGPRLNRPFVLVVHGAELVVPGHLPIIRGRLRRLFRASSGVVASGRYVYEAVRKVADDPSLEVVSIPPGVDTTRFQPLTPEARESARARFGLGPEDLAVVGISRLVPRKGFDRLIKAAALLHKDFPALSVVIAGTGRDQKRLKALAERLNVPVKFLGRVSEEALPRLYGCGDVFAMPCHNRWMGLEREGFGIVFVEAAAAGVPTVVGHSGGSDEALDDGSTGFLVPPPVSTQGVADALRKLLSNPGQRAEFGQAGRDLANSHFSYASLSARLEGFLSSRKTAG